MEIIFYLLKILVFLLHAYIIERLIQKSVELKSLKKDPLGNIGIKFNIRYVKHPNCIEFLDRIIVFKFLNIKKKKIDNKIIVPTIPCSDKIL